MPVQRPDSLLQKLADTVKLNDWFVRRHHRLRTQSNPDQLYAPGKLIAPAESLLELVTTIGEDGMVPDKPYFGRPRQFSLKEMLRVEEDFTPFLGGTVLKFYLAPYDLHYIVAPLDMEYEYGKYVPGWLFPLLITREGDLRNERLTLFFRAREGFPVALTMIASLSVAGMVCELEDGQPVQQGQRIGHFRIGSTVVLCLPPGVLDVEAQQGLKLKLGEPVGTVRNPG